MSTTELARIPNTKLTFRWRTTNAKECYLAICEAVRSGYNTREALLAALPQFSLNRLVLALDALIASGMAHANFGCLSVSDDMLIVEALAEDHTLELPIKTEALTHNSPLLYEILSHLGLQNPSGALVLLSHRIKEVQDVG